MLPIPKPYDRYTIPTYTSIVADKLTTTDI